MNISDELLDRYFKGICTSEEKLLVVNYLKETDDLSQHFLSKDDWDDADDAQISNEKSDEIFAAIKNQTLTKSLRMKWFGITSAAAVVFVLLSVVFLLLNKPEIAPDLAKNNVLKKKITEAINWKSIVNYTSHNQSLVLPDGSTVKIFPGGELRYAVPFVKANREIYLKGKSFFQVTKDKKHPFIVYAKGISTTALGTSFTITATEQDKLIKVELHTGKVWVKNISADQSVLTFDKILLPGSELVYNSIKHQVKVSDKAMLVKELPKLNELNFTQASLKEVFDQLQEYYKIKIIYNADDLDEISFTGTIDLNRKAEKILQEITELNKLNQTKTTEGYLITK
jgi:transmembrane sensor